MTKIKFTRPNNTAGNPLFTGKNGCKENTGVDVMACMNRTVLISAINSKGNIAACDMQIPFEQIDELIAALLEAKKSITA